MSRTIIVRYRTTPEAADENQRLIEQVYAELAATDPGNLRYQTLRLADGVTFVHVSTIDGPDNPLDRSAAFAEFQRGIGDRCDEPPAPSHATIVGSYGY
jgi:hypothetical protein